jgi:hypothetical protein
VAVITVFQQYDLAGPMGWAPLGESVSGKTRRSRPTMVSVLFRAQAMPRSIRIRIRRIRIFIFLHPLYTMITDFIYTIIMTLMNTIV